MMKTLKKITIIMLANLFAVCSLYTQGGEIWNVIPDDNGGVYQLPVIDPAGLSKPYRPLSDFGYSPKEYLHYNFEERKIHYVGDSLSKLLKDLELPVKFVWDIQNGEHIVQADYSRVRLFFETERATMYRMGPQDDFPLELVIDWEEDIPYQAISKRSQLYGNNWNPINERFYGEQIVKDVRVFGKNPSDMPPFPDLDKGETTPCCAPEPITAHTNTERIEREAVSNELNRLLGLMDKADPHRFLKSEKKSPPENRYYSAPDDNIRLNDMFDIAKNSNLVFSTFVRESAASYAVPYFVQRTVLEQGAARHPYGQAGALSNSVTLQTIPVSPYGNYTYKAPTGLDLVDFVYNYTYISSATALAADYFKTAFFIAYDGSVYALRRTDEVVDKVDPARKNLPERHYQNLLFEDLFIIKDTWYSRYLLIPQKDSENLSLKWGFINEAYIQEEFLDAFYRLYNEGSHFSKDDAYIAAFAYILEGRGLAIYRRAPGATEWKRYNTTPVENGGKTTGFRSTVWQ
jgi:hypothetical protein